jgi:hypothetical protein
MHALQYHVSTMCVSAAPARLSNTIVYAGLAHRAGKRVHVMGYQNQAENLGDGPNCMLLHIPSAAPMSPDNMVDTSKCPSVLKDLDRAVRGASLSLSRGPVPRPAAAVVHVFQKGLYTVVLANHWELAGQALERVPAHQRPAISRELLAFYGKEFPGWHLALCCFDNREAVTADPLLWWFEPLFPQQLMAPGIDAHTGKPPRLGRSVSRDHVLLFGTDQGAPRKWLSAVQMQREKLPPAVRELMPALAYRDTVNHFAKNGDFLLDIADLERGRAAVRVDTLR